MSLSCRGKLMIKCVIQEKNPEHLLNTASLTKKSILQDTLSEKNTVKVLYSTCARFGGHWIFWYLACI